MSLRVCNTYIPIHTYLRVNRSIINSISLTFKNSPQFRKTNKKMRLITFRHQSRKQIYKNRIGLFKDLKTKYRLKMVLYKL